ncbi:ABC transporter substrate-binding protein [Candidatus Kaiserbacteria bacterium]|nr:ABC transporter substrate-binding protein [Candidatus Kaiserbacteria bacterium]
MKTIIGILVIILLVIGVIVFTKKPASEETSNGTITIGAIISETGVAAAFGEMSRKGIELAVKEINNTGGVDGRMVSVVFEDDRTDPKAASGAFQKLTSVDKVGAIIGSNFDFVTQPLFSLAETNKTVVVTPLSPRIAGAFDTNAYSFTMMTDFSDIIRTFDGYLKETEYDQLGIVRFESAFGEEIEKTLNAMQSEMGKKSLISETYQRIGNADFKTTILKLKEAKVDMIFLDTVATDTITFVTQAKQLDYTPQIITHFDVEDTVKIQGVDTSLFEGIVLINWGFAPTSFAEKFKKEYGIEAGKAADRAYDAVYVLAHAIAKTPNLSDLPKTLESQSFKTPNVEFGFNPNHAAATTPVVVQMIKDGTVVGYKK